jgi:hypothetical protein
LVRFVTLAPPKSDASLFHLVLIKPTHYDDGYPIQWVKAAIPSNTLACLNGLTEDASRAGCSAPEWQFASTPMTRPIGASDPTGSSG